MLTVRARLGYRLERAWFWLSMLPLLLLREWRWNFSMEKPLLHWPPAPLPPSTAMPRPSSGDRVLR